MNVDVYRGNLFLFVWCFSTHSRSFSSYRDVSISNTHCDTEHPLVWYGQYHIHVTVTPVLRSVKRAPANVRGLNNISDVIFYCSVGERSRALALLNAAQV